MTNRIRNQAGGRRSRRLDGLHRAGAGRTLDGLLHRAGAGRKLVGLAVALALVAAACGGDDDSAAEAPPPPEPSAAAPAPEPAAADEAEPMDDADSDDEATAEPMDDDADDTAAEEPMDGAADAAPESMDDEPAEDEMVGTLVPGQPDINDDGEVIIGIASPGDTNDGGFYQSFVDGARSFADEAGWTVIVSDFINPAESESALADLARQNVDFLAVGATELQDGLDAIACSEEFGHIAMYLNSSLAVENDCYGQSSDDYFQIHWVLGVAAAQLLERTGGTKVGFIGGPELAFVTIAHLSMEAGLKSINPDYEIVVTFTGDFNDAALGVEAARAMLDQDISVIHTFLGGAMFPTGGFIAENGGLAISASANTCFPGSPFAGSSLFPPGDYLVANLRDFADGKYREGAIRPFRVGVDPEVGAVICDPSPDEQAALDEVVAQMGSGELIPQDFVEMPG